MKKTLFIAFVIIAGLILWTITKPIVESVYAKTRDVNTATSTPVVVKEVDILSKNQRVWIGALEYCESRGRSDIKILDSNDRYSYGILQFQMDTFLRYGKKYGIIATSTTELEAEKMIYDPDLQEKVAHRILLDGGEKNWNNCYKKYLNEKYPNKNM